MPSKFYNKLYFQDGNINLSEEQRRNLYSKIDKMNLFNTIKNTCSEQEEAEKFAREELLKKMTVVHTFEDIKYKYSEYQPSIKDNNILLAKPLPVNKITQFIIDCNKLGYTAQVDATQQLDYNSCHQVVI